MSDHYLHGKHISVQYGPRREVEEGEVIACLPNEAQFYGIYTKGLGQDTYQWVADAVNHPAAVIIAYAFRDFVG